MHRLSRSIALAGLLTALVTGLTAGAAAAAGSPTVGHVYVNNNSTGRNSVAGFDRHADGSLTPIPGSPFDAGGAGTGSPFGSAGGLQESPDGRYLLATDPASNQISVLRIDPDGSLQLASIHASNGTTPSSIAIHGGLVYVANDGAGGSNYTGFRLNPVGRLIPIPGSTVALPDDALPGQILISPDGGALFAVNTGAGSVSRYAVAADGSLTLVGSTGLNTPTGLRAFDAGLSPDGAFLYIVDAGVARVSAFAVDGTTITEIAGSPIAIPGGAAPFGMVVD